MLVFIDLEQTVIDSWHTRNYVNTEKVRVWLENNNVSCVIIFSYAITNAADLENFNRQMRDHLGLQLGIEIVSVVDTYAFMEDICQVYSVDTCDAAGILNKSFVFTEYAKVNHSNELVVLLDDDVDNTDIRYPDIPLHVKLVNVNSQQLPQLSEYQLKV